jgi:translation initiation factor 2 beta subunit (eIF-2beta)/eIF-5
MANPNKQDPLLIALENICNQDKQNPVKAALADIGQAVDLAREIIDEPEINKEVLTKRLITLKEIEQKISEYQTLWLYCKTSGCIPVFPKRM